MAHAYYPYEFGSFGGDIHFDEDENWTINVKEEVKNILVDLDPDDIILGFRPASNKKVVHLFRD